MAEKHLLDPVVKIYFSATSGGSQSLKQRCQKASPQAFLAPPDDVSLTHRASPKEYTI